MWLINTSKVVVSGYNQKFSFAMSIAGPTLQQARVPAIYGCVSEVAEMTSVNQQDNTHRNAWGRKTSQKHFRGDQTRRKKTLHHRIIVVRRRSL